MKKVVLFFVALALLCSTAWAGWVSGHTRSDGTWVQPYYRSNPNNTVRDNYDYKGNVNPYTGDTGSNYYRNKPSSEYYDGSNDSGWLD